MKRSSLRYLFLAAILGASLACNFTTQLIARDTPTPAPTATATATFTPSPTPTPTATPTPRPEIRIDLGEEAIFFGDWELASLEYRFALETSDDPEIRAAALLGLARVQVAQEDYAQALDTLRLLLEQHPDSPLSAPANYFLGHTYSALDRFPEAAEAYGAYLLLRPGWIDHYVQEMRGDALARAGEYLAALEAYQHALVAGFSGDTIPLEVKIARTWAAAGEYGNALADYELIRERSSNDYVKAQIDLLSGQAYTALGDLESAYAAYRHAVENYPLSYDSYTALVALVDAGVPVNELDRGLVDYYAGQYGVAIAAFDRALAAGDPSEAATALYYKGLALRALRDYEGALQTWDRVRLEFGEDPLWDESWVSIAYTQWAFLDRYEEAVQTLLDFVRGVPEHPRAAEFLFDAARIAERNADLEQAASLWERVAVEYPLSSQNHRSFFLAGVTRYRQGDFARARGLFQSSLVAAIAPGDAAASHLWVGKCELAMGESGAARAAWERAALADPTGYYSERARDLLLGRSIFEPPQAFDLGIDWADERAEAERWLRTTFNIPAEVDLSHLGTLAEDPRFLRGTELWNLGLYSEARAEFEDLRLAVQNDPAATYRLANHLVDIGLYRSAIFGARRVLDLAGFDDAGTLTAPAYFNHLRFGTYFEDLVFPVAEAYQFHPLLILSVIRQESLFEGFVQSSAGARGLMQIIPTTGQSIHELNSWPPNYDSDDLYRPKVSITFGVDYLHDQRRTFDGDLYAALAAYNGGPGNASIWKSLAPDDPDLFLEVVRFDETRRYIRGIYEIFAIYRRLYDRSP